MLAKILYLHDAAGNLQAVQISPDLWEKLKGFVPVDTQGVGNTGNDMEAFAEFRSAWSFPYPYEPRVACPVCNNSTSDWQKDAAFLLKNANIGGMLVFHCQNCGATVRQKFFKSHMDCDFTPPGQ